MKIEEVRRTINPRQQIRSINIEYEGNSARTIVEKIAKALNFKIHNNGNGISAYGGHSIRISDHRTYMQTWVDSRAWNSPIRLDIVIEDGETQGATDVQNGYNFNIDEYIYSASALNTESARLIAFDILNVLNGGCYANNARGEHNILTSTSSTSKDSNQLNCNNMHESKKVIRLTESELRQIIKNSIRKTLTEDFNYEKTSYQAPPKNNGKLNDWELFNIINSIVKQMIIDKQITPSDGDMLMHYSLYNNDCYGHSFVTSQR